MSFERYQSWSLPSGLVPDEASPEWLSKGDNAWELTATSFVGLQSVPGLVILYGSMVKKKWAVNSAFMALYAFAAALLCWVLWAHQMSFGYYKNSPLVGKPVNSLSNVFLLGPTHVHSMLPNADYVFYQFAFAAITVILLAGSLLGRMNFYAWMIFVGPRHSHDRQHFPPNNIIQILGGAGFLWLGWTGFNGGSPLSAGLVTSLAVINTHICTATSLLVWLALDMAVYKKSSVIGAVQGMITGLVCITPGAGLVDPWAAALMGVMSGSIPWYTMMNLHRKSAFFQSVDDTLGVFHTHAVAGVLGGLLSGLFAKPKLLNLMYGNDVYGPGLLHSRGHIYPGLKQMAYQFVGAVFIAAWNAVVTSIICLVISRIV
ncbi:hypothetical protein Goarm_006231, partial [Gossypium armourianum]|nr:hypothetical protein [Gossypium armourianum]